MTREVRPSVLLVDSYYRQRGGEDEAFEAPERREAMRRSARDSRGTVRNPG